MIQLGQEATKSCPRVRLSPRLDALKDEPSSSMTKRIKAQLLEAFHDIDKAFWQGAIVRDCLRQRALLVDELLRFGWDWFELSPLKLSLVAVGGYGRSTLHPGSDIDCLIITPSNLSEQASQQIEAFIAFVWDCALHLGHSIRTLDECKAMALEDTTVFSNLLDLRYICGSTSSFEHLSQFMFIEAKERKPYADFFKDKLLERDRRYNKFEHNEYTLEPNLKESPGGLRDLHLLGLLIKREFGTHDPNILEKMHIITSQEKQALRASELVLNQIRYALHLETKKREDRLYLDHQQTLATRFGFTGDANAAISSFMQHYYRAIGELRELTSVLVQHFRERYHDQNHNLILQLTPYCQLKDDVIEVTEKQTLESNPVLILEIMEAFAKHECRGFVSTTTRFLRDLYKRQPLEQNESSRPLFLKILNHPKGCARALTMMARLGILSQYLPEFKPTIGQMQYDLYHIYTVDAHTLTLLGTIAQVYEKPNEQPTLVGLCFKAGLNPRIIYLAALFHDIAKGLGGCHSKLGATMVKRFCETHAIDPSQADMIEWLVAHHLLMSDTARTKDLSQLSVIGDFCEHVNHSDKLNYLCFLTLCDIKATNPSLLSTWQMALLSNLYHQASRFLEKGEDWDVSTVTTHQDQAMKLLLEQGYDGAAVKTVWHRLVESYFQSERPEDIAWHTHLLLERSDLPIIAFKLEPQAGGLQLFVFAQDRIHLFALSAAMLDKLQLSVAQARIMTTKDGHGLNTFVLLEADGTEVKGQTRAAFLEGELNKLLGPALKDESMTQIPLVRHHVNRQLRFFKDQAHVSVELNAEGTRNLLTVHAPDFPGLLARLGEAFIACDVFVHSAKINTLGQRVEDIFEISNRQTGRAMTLEDDLLHLKSMILDKLSAYWQS